MAEKSEVKKDDGDKERHLREESKNWVRVKKGEEILEVHNTCVDSHKLLGWQVVE